MIYPNIWGRGALFAFSGLEGETSYEENMVGQLMGERIGMRFDREAIDLFLRVRGVESFTYKIVASDIILGKFNDKADFGFLFINQYTVLGFCPKDMGFARCYGDFATKLEYKGIRILVVDGYYYAFADVAKGGERLFVVAKGNNPEEAYERAMDALKTDRALVIEKKLSYFDKVPCLEKASEQEQRTLAKCFSIMKSQVYAPEAHFKQYWTTPDRLPHKRFWLWDSVFHSFGNIYIDPQLAYDSIRSVFDTQHENGYIPHMSDLKMNSKITQPPVLAWGLYRLYEKTQRKDWLEANYEGLEKYLAWDMTNRDQNKNYLYEWNVNPNEPTSPCDESGMDNTPRFDSFDVMETVDFSAYMANEARYMKKISEILGKTDRAAYYEELFLKIQAAMNEHLYDEEDGRYYDRVLKTGKLKKVQAVSAFIPLFAGVCTEEQAKRLRDDIFNPETFGRPLGVPTISAQEPTFGEDMWRGPIWVNFNYFVICGLFEYGFAEEANKLRQMTLDAMTEWYHKDGVIYEFYDCEKRIPSSKLSRKGPALMPEDPNVRIMAIRDFGWSSTLYVSMLMDREAGK